MNLEALAMLIEVLQRGSIAAVARERGVEPSSVSRSLMALERSLGFRLLDRTTRRLAPTEAGALYVARVRPLVEELRQAREEARDVVASPAGSLRITASVSFGQRCLVPLLPALRRAYPDLAVELLLTDAVLDLREERLDLAVRLGPRPTGDLVASLLMRTRYRVCASPAYVEREGMLSDPSGLVARDCVLFPLRDYRTRWRFRAAGGALLEVPVRGSVVISHALGLRRAALDGLGPALLANWLIDDDIARGELIDLFPEHEATATTFETAAWLLYPSRAYVPRKVRAVIEFLKAGLTEPR